jgi:hypothetical protein
MHFSLILPEALAKKSKTATLGNGLQPEQEIHVKIPE